MAKRVTPKKKAPVKRRVKQHDLRAQTFERLGDDCATHGDGVVFWPDLAVMFRKFAVSEAKLR